MRTYELPCYDSRKSFYGKAQVIEADGVTALRSYDTIVCSIDSAGNLCRHWGGESATTTRHVNSFLAHFGMPGGGLKWWRSLEVTATPFLH